MKKTVFKHNARSYFDVYNALVKAYPNKPTWLFKEMAGLFDFQSELMNRIATDMLDPTTRESAYAFAARCDYSPLEADGCTVEITMTLRESMEKEIAAGYRVGGLSGSTGNFVVFELIENASLKAEIIVDEIAGTVTLKDSLLRIPTDAMLRFSSTHTLPEPIIAGVDYYAVAVDATGKSFKIAAEKNGTAISITNSGSGVHSAVLGACIADFKQQETNASVMIGVVKTQDDFMDFPIDGYKNIILQSISLNIDNVVWTRVDNFDDSLETDTHFRLLYQSNGKCRIQFGNGVYGAKPNLNDVIYASFAVTQGLLGRMADNEIKLNVGGDSDIISVFNAQPTSGGSDPESVASIIRNARANLRNRNAVWTIDDLESRARQASSSVAKVLGIAGKGSAILHVIPKGGDVPTNDLKKTIMYYVQQYTQFGSMPVLVLGAEFVPVDIHIAVSRIRRNFNAQSAKNLFAFALTLITSAFDSQVLEYYDDHGIDECRTNVINTLWSWNFSDDDNGALAFIIEEWKLLLGNREHREWGQYLEVGDLWIMGEKLYEYGIEVFDLVTPLSNVTVRETQIISTGVITLS